MTRPRCTCGRFEAGAAYRTGDCRLCWLAAHDERYRRRWGLTGPVLPCGPDPSSRPRPCRHLWDGVLEFAACGCDALHVRGCDLYDRCTLGGSGGLVPSCATCTSHSARESHPT